MKKLSTLLLSGLLLAAPTTTSAFTDTTSPTQGAVVKTLPDEGIINGYPDYTFQPNLQITRAQAAAMITRAVDLPSVRPAATFRDLQSSHYFYNEIQQLYRAGILDGYNNHFYPDAPIKRGELAKMLTLTFQLTESHTTAFPDVTSTNWATPYIGALVNANITRGYEDGTFKPNNHVTRGEFAYFIYRALYGPETTIDTKYVSDLTRYQPTYLNFIAYEVLGLGYDGNRDVSYDYIEQAGTSFLDYNGLLSFNFREDAILYGANSSDFIFGKVNAPLQAGTTVSNTFDVGCYEPEYVTYNTTLTYIHNFKIKAGVFNHVSKVVVTSNDSDRVETFYLKEGYGLLKHEYASSNSYYQTKTTYELMDFDLKQ